MSEDRKTVLLRAAYQLLKKQKDCPFVLDLTTEGVVYDGAMCDGYCLMDDIESEIDVTTHNTEGD